MFPSIFDISIDFCFLIHIIISTLFESKQNNTDKKYRTG